MSIFLDDKLDLRPGWRFALYVAVFLVLLLATGALLSIVFAGSPLGPLAFLAVNALALTAPAVLAFLFMLRFVDHLPVIAFGVGLHERWGRDLGWGLVVATGMLGLYGVSALVLGSLNVAPAGTAESSAWGIAGLTAILAVSAANEELIYRGYPLQVLMTAIGPVRAVITMSLLFGLGHAFNPNATWLGSLNTTIAGILLCLAYVRTRSLWFPYGIHIGWNLGLGPIFGVPLSGLDTRSIWNTQTGGADWLTGGEYGPEGGVLFTGVMIAAAMAVATTRRVDVSPTLDAVLARHENKVYRGL